MQQMPTREWLYDQYVTQRKTQSQIARESGVMTDKVEQWIKALGLIDSRTKLKLLIDESKFDLSSPVFCYYCGLVAADGYCDLLNLRVSLRLNTIDSSILQLLANYFNVPLRLYKNGVVSDITISSPRLIEVMRDLNIAIPLKTFNLGFPHLPSDESYRMFIRGYLDGDGNIRSKGFRATTGSEEFIRGLINYLNTKFGYAINLTYQKGKVNIYPKIEIGGYKAVRILEWVYSTNDSICVTRKRNKVIEMLNR